jgi:hypothetical protein
MAESGELGAEVLNLFLLQPSSISTENALSILRIALGAFEESPELVVAVFEHVLQVARRDFQEMMGEGGERTHSLLSVQNSYRRS